MKQIKGYNGRYFITKDGEVISLFRNRQRVLKTGMSNKGYKDVKLTLKGDSKHFYIHRLVAEYFIENSQGLPFVNHLNFNPLDNRIENLEWTDRVGNMQHSAKVGRVNRGGNNGMSKLNSSQVKQILKLYGKVSGKYLAKKFNISPQTICCIGKRRYWKHITI